MVRCSGRIYRYRAMVVRRGKEIAQGAHASMAWLTNRISEYFDGIRTTEYDPYLNEMLSPPEFQWVRGSFRKVTVQVDSGEELFRIHEDALVAGLTSELILDAGTTEFGGIPTYTALAIGPDYDEKIDPVTGHLKLY